MTTLDDILDQFYRQDRQPMVFSESGGKPVAVLIRPEAFASAFADPESYFRGTEPLRATRGQRKRRAAERERERKDQEKSRRRENRFQNYRQRITAAQRRGRKPTFRG